MSDPDEFVLFVCGCGSLCDIGIGCWSLLRPYADHQVRKQREGLCSRRAHFLAVSCSGVSSRAARRHSVLRHAHKQLCKCGRNVILQLLVTSETARSCFPDHRGSRQLRRLLGAQSAVTSHDQAGFIMHQQRVRLQFRLQKCCIRSPQSPPTPFPAPPRESNCPAVWGGVTVF